MNHGREARQVAKRALILGAVSFRSALEVTADSRAPGISRRLLPWLEEVGCGDVIDPIERDLLMTAHGSLGESLMIDARWAGEAAAIFCWMLTLGAEVDATKPVNPATLPGVLGILKQKGGEIIATAILRERGAIDATCRRFVLILSMLRESRIDPATREIIRRMHVKELQDVGICITEQDVHDASEVMGRMDPEARKKMAGAYVVRHRAALWFLSDGSRWWVDAV